MLAVMALNQIGDKKAIPALQQTARINISKIWNIGKDKALYGNGLNGLALCKTSVNPLQKSADSFPPS